jgi:TfoX/Sxy family transcriptional regulator of competence genes
MAYDEGLAQRLREIFEGRNDIVEKKMFGGIAYMAHGNMCCGIIGDTLMARVGPEQYAAALKKPHAREMTFTLRPMKGFVYVDPPGFETDKALKAWVKLCDKYVATLPIK